MKFKLDCKFFKGDKPCKYNRLCSGCKEYRPMGKKILIIKFASIGDVLRTTPILRGVKVSRFLYSLVNKPEVF